MKNKIILAGVLILLLAGLVIAAKDEISNMFMDNLSENIKAKVTEIMNTMTPQEALELRMKQIAEEQQKTSSDAESLE
ncbi:MAG: hypothetical protein AABY07_08305 [Nanoarchaeota archaeon]